MKRDPYKHLKEVRDDIIDKALIIGLVVGVVTYLMSLTTFSKTGFEPSFITDLFVLLLIAIVVVRKKKISIQVKSYFVLFALSMAILVDVYELGILSANKVLLVLIPFFTVTSFSLKRTSFFLFAIVGAIFFLGYLHLSEQVLIPAEQEIGFVGWLINIILIVFAGIVLMLITLRFNTTYQKMIDDIIANNKKIEESEQNYREIFNSTSDLIVVFNDRFEIEEYNDSVYEMFGFDSDIDAGKLRDKLMSNDRQLFEDRFAIVKQKKSISFDVQIPNDLGELVWVDVLLKPAVIRNENKIIGIFRDINEKKNTRIELEQYKNQLEEKVNERTLQLTNQTKELKNTIARLNETQVQLIHSEKMASVGLLASGIAHEINNPLNFIHGGINAVEIMSKSGKNLSDDKDFNKLISGIKEGVDRASTIVKGLNQYGRSTDQTVEDCDVPRIVGNCLIMLKSELGSRIKVKRDYKSDYTTIKGNSGKLHQIFLNVLTNSIHAIPEQGEISVNIHNDDKNIITEISDTGTGIPKKHLEKISDPFFTTKEVGKGTGLGLYIVFNLVNEHNGTIKINSEEGKGTSIAIYLPF